MTNANLEKKASFLMDKITIERNQIDYFRSQLHFAEERQEHLEEDIVDLQNQMDEDPNYDSSLLSIVSSLQDEFNELSVTIGDYESNISESQRNIKLYMNQYDEIIGYITKDFSEIELDENFLNNKSK